MHYCDIKNKHGGSLRVLGILETKMQFVIFVDLTLARRMTKKKPTVIIRCRVVENKDTCFTVSLNDVQGKIREGYLVQ